MASNSLGVNNSYVLSTANINGGVLPRAPVSISAAGGFPATGSAAASSPDYGQRTAGNLPVFWLLVMLVVGVILLSHVANISIKQ